MGNYINQNSKGETLSTKGKAKALIADGAIVIPFSEIQIGDVAVVENAFFDAALYIDDYELDYMKRHGLVEQRPVTYLRYPHAATVNDDALIKK